MVGEWKYHDHISPQFTGKIKVSRGDAKEPSFDCKNLLEKDPTTFDEKVRIVCWKELLQDSLKKGGTKEAYKVFTKFYDEDPRFVGKGCHQHAHAIGDFGYAEYLKHRDIKKLELSLETTYCGYGYYHGLLEHLLRDEMDINFSKEICSYLVEKLSDSMPNIKLTCYHGIGHGFVAIPVKGTVFWGNASKIMKKILQFLFNRKTYLSFFGL